MEIKGCLRSLGERNDGKAIDDINKDDLATIQRAQDIDYRDGYTCPAENCATRYDLMVVSGKLTVKRVQSFPGEEPCTNQ